MLFVLCAARITIHGMPLIRNISDTALLAAVYRARESERADPLFCDPFARRLAGQRGEEIARSLVFSEKNSWSWYARTYVFDQMITKQIAAGCDMVVNLAAGLDARPYRMALPASLNWIEVDLPEIIDYKEELLKDEQPLCALERVQLNLADVTARRQLFTRLSACARQALIISEGLIVYLTTEAVGALAKDLAAEESFRHWLLDLASPALLKIMQKKNGQAAGASRCSLTICSRGRTGFLQGVWLAGNRSAFDVSYGWKIETSTVHV